MAEEGTIPSADTIWDAFDDAAAETVMGLFMNDAVAWDYPFCNGPLAAASEVMDIVVDQLQWYNNARLQ